MQAIIIIIIFFFFLQKCKLPSNYVVNTCECYNKEKFLNILGVGRNDTPSCIYDGFHYEFNEWTLLWMWEEITQFSVLRD